MRDLYKQLRQEVTPSSIQIFGFFNLILDFFQFKNGFAEYSKEQFKIQKVIFDGRWCLSKNDIPLWYCDDETEAGYPATDANWKPISKIMYNERITVGFVDDLHLKDREEET